MELLESLSLKTSVKMGGATKLLVNFSSMEVSNLSESLRFGVADCLLFPIPGLHIALEDGAVLVQLVLMEILVLLLLLESGVEFFLLPI